MYVPEKGELWSSRRRGGDLPGGGSGRGGSSDPLRPGESHPWAARRNLSRAARSLRNSLHSINADTAFVTRFVAGLDPPPPVLANLRCGAWYVDAKSIEAADRENGRTEDREVLTCRFKSTDGHHGNWKVSPRRLNMHVALLCGRYGECVIVDATRAGKRFPDALSRTVPMWCCAVNRTLARWRETRRKGGGDGDHDDDDDDDDGSGNNNDSNKDDGRSAPRVPVPPPPASEWDTALHMPPWIPEQEASWIESEVLPAAVDQLLRLDCRFEELDAALGRPLRCTWHCPTSPGGITGGPGCGPAPTTGDYSIVRCVSASTVSPEHGGQFVYRPGAADDEEFWSRGLTSDAFHDPGNRSWLLAIDDDDDLDAAVDAVVEAVKGKAVLPSSQAAGHDDLGRRLNHLNLGDGNADLPGTLVLDGVAVEIPLTNLFVGDHAGGGLPRCLHHGVHAVLNVGDVRHPDFPMDDGDAATMAGGGNDGGDSDTNHAAAIDASVSMHRSGVRCLHLPIEDKRKPDLKWSLQNALEVAMRFVVGALARGERVLVHGGAGGNRAPAVCIAVLLRCADRSGRIDPDSLGGIINNGGDGGNGGDTNEKGTCGKDVSSSAAATWDPRACVVPADKDRVNLVTSWVTAVHPNACLSRAFVKQLNRFFQAGGDTGPRPKE